MTLEMKAEQKTGAAGQENGHVGHETVYVDQFVDGILDPNKPMLGPVRDGGHIVANTARGCWGPMLTPEIRGGHEVTKPVAVAGAEVGDAPVAEQVDRQQAAELLAQLKVLLSNFDTEACDYIEVNAQSLSSGPLASLFVQLSRAVDQYDFEQGLDVVSRMQAALADQNSQSQPENP